MPRHNLPPTPAASSDLAPKLLKLSTTLDTSFILPPAALNSKQTSASSSSASNASTSSYHPLSPTSPVAPVRGSSTSKKRPLVSQKGTSTDDFGLPPPPTRSRKIIQMDPRTKVSRDVTKAQAASSSKVTTNAGSTTAAGAKRKQPNGTTSAGRKAARKTAHSEIERRRRSKMNEEFGVLKDMIPACEGQEMHKLQILQASIEYMRYLQTCVADLKKVSQRSRVDTLTSPPQLPPSLPTAEDDIRDESDDDNGNNSAEDEDMSDAFSPAQLSHSEPKAPPIWGASNPNSTTTSPAINPSDKPIYSALTSPNIYSSDMRHYSLASSIHSAATSPSIHPSPGASGRPYPASQSQSAGASLLNFSLTSPALGPQTDPKDHEVMEALMMLNHGRRNPSDGNGKPSGGRGMSVKDLLSG